MAAAQDVNFRRVADYMRSRDTSNVSLSDVVALAEIAAESFGAFFKSMDATIYRELHEIADYIINMKSEIGVLQANDLKTTRIPAAGRELDLIVQQTEEATNTIMGCAEAMMSAPADDLAAYQAFVNDTAMKLFEACSFQDLTGQRVRKVVETLHQIELRVTRFATALNAKDAAGFVDEAERKRAERAEKLLLNGPQESAVAIKQDSVDKMFDTNDGQDAIDALFP